MVRSGFKDMNLYRAVVAILLLCCVCLSGCGSTYTKTGFYDAITADLREHQFDSAAVKIEAAKEKNNFGTKDRFLYFMDAGLAYHYASLIDSSNLRLSAAEDAADELYTKSISKAVLSAVLNDNALDYAGEDYEILYTNLFMCLNYINENKYDDAFVEVRRANEKLNLLEQKYRDASANYNDALADDSNQVKLYYEAKQVRFNNNAFARYLSMHMYASEGLYDDARIDYDFLQQAFIEQPHIYNFPVPGVIYKTEQKAILSVVGLAGLAPVKEALNLRIRTDKQLDLVQVMYTDPERKNTEYTHLPVPISEDYYFKLSIPQIVTRPGIIEKIRVTLNDHPEGELQLIEDVGMVANETFEAKKSLIFLRTVARAVAKGLATHKMKKKADDGGVGGWLKKAAIDIGSDLTENADLRCSRLLPGKIYVGDFKVEPGVYNIKVEFLDMHGEVVSTTLIEDYRVEANGLNMVEAFSLN